MIQKILVDEEGDLGEDGQSYLSHFELYLLAMQRIGANTQLINLFLQKLESGESVSIALCDRNLPVIIRQFVRTTFSFFEQDTYLLAAAFVYGREAITSSLFTPIMYQLERHLNPQEKISISTLMYYLKRHIQLDEEDHFPQALRMLQNLTGDDSKKWQALTKIASYALQARLNFLTGIQSAMAVTCF